MSLLPFLLDDSYVHPRTSRSFDDFIRPFELLLSATLPKDLTSHLDKDTSIEIDKDRFQANIDVQQFRPEEISVKLTEDNTVTIEGKHEEKQDEHGFISRHFVRKYVLPKDCDVKHLQSRLSSDGVLSIVAPKKPEEKQVEYRDIPVIRTGPVINAEQKKLNHADSPTIN